MTILSYFTQNLANFANPNVERWVTYCQARGYAWTCHMPRVAAKDASFAKIPYILDSLRLGKESEALVWVDIDVVVKDLRYDLRQLLQQTDREILISSDRWGLCCGFIMIRPTHDTFKFFEMVHMLGNLNDSIQTKLYGKNKEEQSVMKYLHDGFESVRKLFYFIGQDIISNPHTLRQTAPLHHFWAHGGQNHACCEKILQCLAQAPSLVS